MTRAMAFRFPQDLVDRTRKAAAEADLSLTAYVTGAIEARLAAPSLTQMPMKPVVPRGAPERMEQCAHPFRDEQNRCRMCGEMR